MINMNHSLESRMLADFELEVGECKKLLAGREVIPGSHGRAMARIAVIIASVEELKKQMKNPLRHSMLVEGVNPETGQEYMEMEREFKEKFNNNPNFTGKPIINIPYAPQ